MQDPAHAPVYNWSGYAIRYIPLMAAIGAIVFLGQYWWHVNTIRRQSGFRYTYKAEEPRLCRIAEPLVIASGLPEPRLAVIESPALNAFACGLGPISAVLVVTRGLIDSLDDEELAAVIAHELAHVRNGGLRLMAAANVCLRSLTFLYQPTVSNRNRVREAAALPISLFAMPALFVVVLMIGFLRQSAIHLAHLTRRLISSARAFIADAEAVGLTQNPAALVSALGKIEGHSHVPTLPPEQDAMMIDGPNAGAMATHPSIADRIAAIVRFTGSMTFIAPSRRDTRPFAAAGAAAIGGRTATALVMDMRQSLAARPARTASNRAAVASERNMFGLKAWKLQLRNGPPAARSVHRRSEHRPEWRSNVRGDPPGDLFLVGAGKYHPIFAIDATDNAVLSRLFVILAKPDIEIAGVSFVGMTIRDE